MWTKKPRYLPTERINETNKYTENLKLEWNCGNIYSDDRYFCDWGKSTK